MAESGPRTYAPVQCSSPTNSTGSLGTVAQDKFEIESLELRLHGNNALTRMKGQSDLELQELESRPPTRMEIRQDATSIVYPIVKSLPEVVELNRELTRKKIYNAMEIENMQHKIKITQLRNQLEYLEKLEKIGGVAQGDFNSQPQNKEHRQLTQQ